MNIEAGKRYWMRNGGITAPMRARVPDKSGYALFHFTDGFLSWTKSGTYYIDEKTRDPYDLVVEYTGPELIPELIPPLIPKIGTRYVTNWDWITTPVVSVDGASVIVGEASDRRGLLITSLRREYLGKDDPINKEPPCEN